MDKRPIPSIPGAFAFSDGSVQMPQRTWVAGRNSVRTSNKTPTFGTLSVDKTNYKYRKIFSRFYGTLKVSRLVCEAFHGKCPEGMQVSHLNEDSLDNRPENLKWVTQLENLNMPKYKARMSVSSKAQWAKRKGVI